MRHPWIAVFDPKLGRYWLPMTVGAIIFLAGQVRSDWFGAALSFLIWGVLEKKIKPVLMFFLGLVALLLLVPYLMSICLHPPPAGGAISSREIVARGLYQQSTPRWRKTIPVRKTPLIMPAPSLGGKMWWDAIWANSRENKTNFIIGPGYGFLLKKSGPPT